MPIEARNISFAYETNTPVLRKVSAVAEQGRITAIIGPNAVGKTTLLRILAGILTPQSGEVLINDTLLSKYPRRNLARQLAYVSQRPIVDAPFSVREVVSLGSFPHHNQNNKSLTSILEKCALTHLADTPFHQLSVGQQQRVSIARAVNQLQQGGPEKILLLDEPMSAMDPKHIERTGQLLRQTANLGSTILIVLHDLQLASALADDIWVLNNNTIKAAGPVASAINENILTTVYGCNFELIMRDKDHPDIRPKYHF